MKYYIALDGGGSKLQAVLFDENYNYISSAKSGGTNESSTSREDVVVSSEKCFRDLIGNRNIDEIECVYGVFTTTVKESLSNVIKVNKFDDRGGEGAIGIYAAFVSDNAVVTLSGTGSVVFYARKDGQGAEAGGYGSILYDEGSGYYLGRRAFAAAIEDAEERGPKTLLTDLITKKMNANDFFDATYGVFHNYIGKSPISSVAAVATCVGEAARAGDPIAEKLLFDVGKSLADQTVGLIRKFKVPEGVPIIITGGHFKNDIRILNSFKANVNSELPDREIIVPYFEPIIGAVLASRYHDNGEFSNEEIEHIKEQFADFKYHIIGEE